MSFRLIAEGNAQVYNCFVNLLSYYCRYYAACSPIGSITRLACSYIRLSVCQPVCPIPAHSSKTKERRKIKIGINVPHDTSKWSANFHFKRSKVKVPDVKNLKIAAYPASLLTGSIAGGQTAN